MKQEGSEPTIFVWLRLFRPPFAVGLHQREHPNCVYNIWKLMCGLYVLFLHCTGVHKGISIGQVGGNSAI